MTTVTITDETHRKLERLKEERDAKSFDQLLNDLADEELEIPSTEEMFGSMKVKDKDKVRDRNDRIDRYNEEE